MVLLTGFLLVRPQLAIKVDGILLKDILRLLPLIQGVRSRVFRICQVVLVVSQPVPPVRRGLPLGVLLRRRLRGDMGPAEHRLGPFGFLLLGFERGCRVILDHGHYWTLKEGRVKQPRAGRFVHLCGVRTDDDGFVRGARLWTNVAHAGVRVALTWSRRPRVACACPRH